MSGIPAAGFDQAAVVVVQAREREDVLFFVFRHGFADGGNQFSVCHFVAVYAEDPIVLREAGGKIFHRAEADEVVFVITDVGEAFGDFEGTVGRAVVEQQYFVEVLKCGQNFVQIAFRILTNMAAVAGIFGFMMRSSEKGRLKIKIGNRRTVRQWRRSVLRGKRVF